MKKVKLFLLAALLLLSLTGCQLAQPEIQSSGDMLAGVFITTEPLDLFDVESYLTDNLRVSGGEIVVDGDTSAYQGRLYGTLEPVTLHDEDGNEYTSSELVFEGLEGMPLISAQLEDGNGSYERVFSGDGMLNSSSHFITTDDGERVELEGEIWLPQTDGTITAYFNPVYVDGDGNFYLTSGQGFQTSGDNAPGGLYSQTLEDSRTVTENGQSTTRSLSVKVTLGTMYAPEAYVLWQMNGDNRPLRQTSYLPGQLPEELTMEADTAYLLVEAHYPPSADGPTITRTVYDPAEDQTISTYYAQNGLMLKATTAIHWK